MTAASNTYVQRVIVTIFFVALGIYLFLAMVTYTPFDPGWTHISSDTQKVSNASGVVGAWVADLLFGFLGWACLLLPIYLFIEAMQLWWPRSFLNRQFRYAAQFFIILATSSLLYLFWKVPADTLDNASGGIIGYELGQSLSGLLSIYGAALFLIVLDVFLFTLAFGVKWNKTWSTLQAAPAYLQDLFYRKLPEPDEIQLSNRTDSSEYHQKILEKSQLQKQQQAIEMAKIENETAIEPTDVDTAIEKSELKEEIQSEQTAEIQPILESERDHFLNSIKTGKYQAQDPSDNAILAELLSNIPEKKSEEHVATAEIPEEHKKKSQLIDADLADEIKQQSQIFIQKKQDIKLDKEEFLEAWQQTAGKPEEFDLDAPLTDLHGRPLSRAMQLAEKRKTLSKLPSLALLDKVDPNKKISFTQEQLARLSELLEIKLQEFNVKAKVIDAQPGPVVTRFELDLAPGIKASKVTNISRDLARSMSMASVRVVEVIPGKPYIGIEIPNSSREMVRLIELIDTPEYRDPSALISMAMGKDISGRPVLTDLAKAPHMLVAGTTGSGKSVAVNSMILSMLLKYTPSELRLIMIDPKQLELANYNDIPHLLTPVVTDMKDAVNALNWCVNEMERRYKLMSLLKIRKLADYNRKVQEAIENGEDLIDPTWRPSDSATQERAPRLEPLPTIVIIADEFADMIMQVGKKAEEMITRLAQKSRAAGIHLLLATQRPTVDVVTGLIKANIPTRVALRVNSKLDSRTILDAGGAEDLLGHGDMLFLGPGKIEPERVHGAFISDDEVNRICDAWRERGSPNYVDEILTPYDEEPTSRGFEESNNLDRDPLYDQCVAFVLEVKKPTASLLQRKFSVGYNRAARIIDQMEEGGIVGPAGANGKRDIIV